MFITNPEHILSIEVAPPQNLGCTWRDEVIDYQEVTISHCFGLIKLKDKITKTHPAGWYNANGLHEFSKDWVANNNTYFSLDNMLYRKAHIYVYYDRSTMYPGIKYYDSYDEAVEDAKRIMNLNPSLKIIFKGDL